MITNDKTCTAKQEGSKLTKLLKPQEYSQLQWRSRRGALGIFLLAGMLLSLHLISSNNFASYAKNPLGTAVQELAYTDSETLIPLTDMGNSTYCGYQGGLYPEGINTMPISHLDAGIAQSKQIIPRDATGQQSTSGKIVLLSIGMSNTLMEFEEFRKAAMNDSSLNPSLIVVNGAEGGMTAARILNPSDNSSGTQYWTNVDQKLTQAGVTRMQVQAIWLLEADAAPTGSPIVYAQTLAQEQVTIAQILSQRFPNLKQLYLSSRIYGGYATSNLNPEPYAYASGFAVKWTIEKQINGSAELNYDPGKGAVKAPWMAWGPYMWANGSLPRMDGLTWSATDFGTDGTHPSPQGCRKVADLLLSFLKSNSASQPWFLQATIPEFPSWAIFPLVITATLPTILLFRRKIALASPNTEKWIPIFSQPAR